MQVVLVDATVSKPFDPDADCEKSAYDVLGPQQFQDSITTAQPIQRSVPKEAIKKGMTGQGCQEEQSTTGWYTGRPGS